MFYKKTVLIILENSQFPADLITFTEDICNGKLHFLYSGKKFLRVVELKLLFIAINLFKNMSVRTWFFLSVTPL